MRGHRLGAGGLDRGQSAGERRGEDVNCLPIDVLADTRGSCLPLDTATVIVRFNDRP